MQQNTSGPSASVSETPMFVGESEGIAPVDSDVFVGGDESSGDETYDLMSSDMERTENAPDDIFVDEEQKANQEQAPKQKQKQQAESNKYKSKTHGEVDIDLIEKLLEHKDVLPEIENVSKFRAEIQTAANKKFLEAKREREMAEQSKQEVMQLVEYAKKNPLEFIKATGVNIDDLVKSNIEEEIKMHSMTPAERQMYVRNKAIEKEMQSRESKIREYEQRLEQQQRQAEHQQREEKFISMAKKIAEVHAASEVSDDPETVFTIAKTMQAAAALQREDGIERPIEQIVRDVGEKRFKGAVDVITNEKSKAKVLSEYRKNPQFRDFINEIATQRPAEYEAKRKARSSQTSNTRFVDEAKTIDQIASSNKYTGYSKFIGDSDIRQLKLQGKW